MRTKGFLLKLQDFIGNQRLAELLRGHPLPEASIFIGPDGVGKKTFALCLSAFANCNNPTSDDLCGMCSSCVKSEFGNHPDIVLFQPEQGVIRIDAMRQLSKEAFFRPFEGRRRFFIIDQAEKMTEEAANSILKTLEEPPETTCVVLISAFPRRLLATVRSRCQMFFFQPVKRDKMIGYLQKREERDDPSLRASFSEGSIGTALRLDVTQTVEDRDLMLKLLVSWSNQRSFEVIYKICEEQPLRVHLKKRDRVQCYLHLLQLLLEDLYFIQMEREEQLVNQDRKEDLKRLSESLELIWIRDFLYHIGKAKWDIDHYVNPLMCFETLWLRSRREKPNVRDFLPSNLRPIKRQLISSLTVFN